MEENKMKKHVTIVAAIRIAFSTLGLLGIIFILTVFGFVMDFIPVEELPKQVLPLIKGIFSFLMISAAFVSTLGIIAGIGLLTYKSWGRILTLVVSAFSLLNIPFGTLLGAYSFWVLLEDDTVKLFKEQSSVQKY